MTVLKDEMFYIKQKIEIKRKELGIKVEFKNFWQNEKDFQKMKRLKYEEKAY